MNDQIVEGIIKLYNPFKINSRTIRKKFRYHTFPQDFTVSLNNVHFYIDDEFIEMNISMNFNYENNNIHFINNEGSDIVICNGMFRVNVPYEYIEIFNNMNKGSKGFLYDIDFISVLTREKLTNDCIEIEYPYNLYFKESKIIEEEKKFINQPRAGLVDVDHSDDSDDSYEED